MIIPFQQLAPETLKAVLESFALREGTDYGEQEVGLESKLEQLKGQLQRGELLLCFDEPSESINLITPQQAREMGL
ncbi:YheU family protein [uncultured Pseudoteredinibacter sp.]|uniref:YheU family protein n=1 Tax=uncultured Pseudoteredinibacter sp. TaxID=1641701 RepID=UPI00262E64A0|nr:YheU family protein [uncultured Pseudoteredinibacter sp.]